MVNAANMVNEVSQAAIGRALGLSPAAITKLKGQGMPVNSVAAAQVWREQRQNVAARKPLPEVIAPPRAFEPPSPDIDIDSGEDHDSARTRLRISEANRSEMDEARLRREQIRVSAVERQMATDYATTRDALLQIPARMAPLLAAESDPTAIHNMLHDEIHRSLMTLAGAADQLMHIEGGFDERS